MSPGWLLSPVAPPVLSYHAAGLLALPDFVGAASEGQGWGAGSGPQCNRRAFRAKQLTAGVVYDISRQFWAESPPPFSALLIPPTV